MKNLIDELNRMPICELIRKCEEENSGIITGNGRITDYVRNDYIEVTP